jgi:DNA-binding transcriptional MerR regulator
MNMLEKSPQAFRTISEVSSALDVPQHVLRFWETKFGQVKPMKRGGGRRYYRPEDVDLLRGIRTLLYADGFTIKGVQKVLREQGVRTVVESGQRQAGARMRVRLAPRTEESAAQAQAPAVPPAPVASHALGPGPRRELETVLSRLVEAKALLQRRRAALKPKAKAQGA